MSIMWVWWMTQLAFIFLVEIFRYIIIGFIAVAAVKIVLRRFAR
jgi:hypothetical protein